MSPVCVSRASLALWSAFCGCALVSGEFSVDLPVEKNNETNFTTTQVLYSTTQVLYSTTQEAAPGLGGPRGMPTPGPVFVLKLLVVDSGSGQPLNAAFVQVYINLRERLSARTQEDGLAWFYIPHQSPAVVSAVASREGYVTALLPVTTEKVPVFSSVTLPLVAVSRGNLWLFNDSLLSISKSTGHSGAEPLVQFSCSGLNLTEDSVSALTALMNSPSVWAPEGVVLHTTGTVSSSSGPVLVDLSPVASVWVQLWSSGSGLQVSGPVHMRLPLGEGCGLQEGAHVPAWTLDHDTGSWVRRGLGSVEVVDGTLVWTFAAPHLGHWMAAPLSPSRGLRLEDQVDFLLRHGSFLMILLGSTLVVAVGLLLGLLCRPRSSQSESKVRRPAVNPLVSVKDQSTSTSDDQVVLLCERPDLQYTVCNFNTHELQDDNTSQTTHNDLYEPTLSHAQTFGEGLIFYQVLQAPGIFHMDQMSEEQWSKSVSLPRMDSKQHPQTVTFTEIKEMNSSSREKGMEEVKEVKTSGFPESLSEPGTLGQRLGPRAWFVSLEGKPAAEIRYNVTEEQRRRRQEEEEQKRRSEEEEEQRRRREQGRDVSLDSGLDLSEGAQVKQEVKLERNATFVKKSSKKQKKEKD